MTFDPGASKRATEAAGELADCGLTSLAADLVRDVWARNVARYDPTVGDTVRVIAIQSAENIAQLIVRRARKDKSWTDTGVVVTPRNNSLLLQVRSLRIHFVKVPHSSGLNPDWNRDFDWATSQVRLDAAEANDAVYRSPRLVAGIDPLISADGLGVQGDPGKLVEHFVVWGATISEDPQTRGWLVLPAVQNGPVAAVVQLWDDSRGDGGAARSRPTAPTLGDPTEPSLVIRLRPDRPAAANG